MGMEKEMIKNDTIINRFESRYGEIRPTTNLPSLMIGTLLGERFGLTFKYDEVIRHMIVVWNYDGELDFSKTWMKDIYQGLQYEDNNHKVIWDINDILDSIRVLDSIPFKNVD